MKQVLISEELLRQVIATLHPAELNERDWPAHYRLSQVLEQPAVEPVYAFRRKGLDDFCTCSKERFDELSNKPHLFETTIFCAAPKAQQPALVQKCGYDETTGNCTRNPCCFLPMDMPQAPQPAPLADVPLLTDAEIKAVQVGIAVDDFAYDLVRRTEQLVRQKAGLK